MASLSVGYYTLECDGSVVSCAREGSVLGTASLPEGDSTELDFGAIHFCLNPSEWDVLLGRAEAVEEAPVAEEVAAPAATSRRGRRKA